MLDSTSSICVGAQPDFAGFFFLVFFENPLTSECYTAHVSSEALWDEHEKVEEFSACSNNSKKHCPPMTTNLQTQGDLDLSYGELALLPELMVNKIIFRICEFVIVI